MKNRPGETRPADHVRTVGVLSLLFGKNTDLIQRGIRSPEMIAALEKSLQLFFENRLAAALGVQAVTSLPENLLGFLSLAVDDIPISKPAQNWLRFELGVEFLGEIYLVPFKRRFGRAKGSVELHSYITKAGLPTEVDLDHVGWVPPYFSAENRESTMQLLTRHWHQINRSPKYFCSGCRMVGQSIRKQSRRTAISARSYRGIGVHLGMFIPRDIEFASSHDPALLQRVTLDELRDVRIENDFFFGQSVHALLRKDEIFNVAQLVALTETEFIKGDQARRSAWRRIQKDIGEEGLRDALRLSQGGDL